MLIIASFLVVSTGCGVKKAPYYEKSAPAEDENVRFVIQKQDSSKTIQIDENNESCN